MRFVESQSGSKLYLPKAHLEHITSAQQGILPNLKSEILSIFFSKKALLVELILSILIFALFSSSTRFFIMIIKILISLALLTKKMTGKLRSRKLLIGASTLIEKNVNDVMEFLHDIKQMPNWRIWSVKQDTKSRNSFFSRILFRNKNLKGEFYRCKHGIVIDSQDWKGDLRCKEMVYLVSKEELPNVTEIFYLLEVENKFPQDLRKFYKSVKQQANSLNLLK